MPPPPLNMIRVFCEGTTLTLQGHAGSGLYGQDLVCAAVSGLVYALAQRLTEREGVLEEPPVIKLEPGDARISAIPKANCFQQVRSDFCLIESGLRLLERHYPEQLQVNGLRDKERKGL